jgi:type I restriction enzyme M protein
MRDSAKLQREASPQVVSIAKDNMAGVGSVCLRCASAVLANGSMSSNQSGDCPARSASSKPQAKPQSLPRQRDIRRALIEADLVDTALRDIAFPQSEATPQVLSAAKNNMAAFPGQHFYSTQIPVCLWFLVKNKNADAKHGFRDRRERTRSVRRCKLLELFSNPQRSHELN